MMIIRPGRILKLVVFMPWILLCSLVTYAIGFLSMILFYGMLATQQFNSAWDWVFLILTSSTAIMGVRLVLCTIYGIYKDLSYKSIFIQPFVDKKDQDQKKETLWWWDK